MATATNTVYVSEQGLQDLPAPNMIFSTIGTQQQQWLAPGYHPCRLPEEAAGQCTDISTLHVHNEIPSQATSGGPGDTLYTNHAHSCREQPTVKQRRKNLMAVFKKSLRNKTASYNAERSVSSVKSLTVTNPMAMVAEADQQDLSDLQLHLFERAPQMPDTSGFQQHTATAPTPTSPVKPVEMLQMAQMEMNQEPGPYPMRQTSTSPPRPQPTELDAPPLPIIVEQPISTLAEEPAEPEGEPSASLASSDLDREQPTSPGDDDLQLEVTDKALETSPPAVPLEDTRNGCPEMNAQPMVVVVEQLATSSKEEHTNPDRLQPSVDTPPPNSPPPASPSPAGPPPDSPPPASPSPAGPPPDSPPPYTPPPDSPDRELPTSPDIEQLDNPDETPPGAGQKCKEKVDIESLTDGDIEICHDIDTTEAEKLIESGEADSPERPCCDTVFASCTCLKGGFSRFLSGQDQNLNFTPLLKVAAKKGFKFFMRYISPLQTKYLLGTLIYKIITLIILLVMFITSLVRLSNRIHQSKSYGYDVGIALVSTVAFFLDLFDIIQSIATYRHKVRDFMNNLVNWCKQCHSKESQEQTNPSPVTASKSESEDPVADESHPNASTCWHYFSKYSELIILLVTEALLYTNIILTLFAFICDETFKSISDDAESFIETLKSWIVFILGIYIFRPILLGFNVMVVREAIQRQDSQLAKGKSQQSYCPSSVGKLFNFQVWLVIHIIGQSVFHAFLLICIGWKIAQENCHLPPSAQSIKELSCTRPQHFSFFTFYNVLFGIAAPWLSFVAFLFANVPWSKEFYIKLYLDCLLKSVAIQSATKEEVKGLAKTTAKNCAKKILKQMMGMSEATEKSEEHTKQKLSAMRTPAADYIKQLKDGRQLNPTAHQQFNIFAKTQEHFARYASHNPLVKGLHAVAFGPTALCCTIYFVIFFLHIIFLGCRVDEAGQNVCGRFEFSVFKGTVEPDSSDYGALVFFSFVFFGITNLQSFGIGFGYTIVIVVIVYTILLILAITLLFVCFAGAGRNNTNNRRRP